MGLVCIGIHSEYSVTCGIIQSRGLSSPQDITEDAEPDGSHPLCGSAEPAPHAAPLVLAESLHATLDVRDTSTLG